MKKIAVFTFALLMIVAWGPGAPAQETYTVERGDTLSGIAKRKLGDADKWIKLYEVNKSLISDADRIEIGWVLTLPSRAEAAKPRPKRFDYELVTGNNYEPFTDQKLPEDGMITEIVEKAFKKMGYTVNIEFWSWKFGFDATREGRFAATFPYLKNEQRARNFYYSRPIYKMLVRWFVRDDFNQALQAPRDFKGLTCCRPEGYYTHDIAEYLEPGYITLKRPEDIGDCFKMLEQGRVDLVPVNEFTGWAAVQKTFDSTEGFKVLDEAVSVETLHLIASKRSPGGDVLIHEFDQALDEMEKSGRLNDIINYHLDFYWRKYGAK